MDSNLQTILSERGTMQAIIDNSAQLFDPPVWKTYMDWQFSSSLTFKDITGTYTTTSAASVVEYGSPAPERSRPKTGSIAGSIPSLKALYTMTPTQIREYLELQRNVELNILKIDELFNYIYGDIKNASLAPHKRLDIFVLEGLSTGSIVNNTTKNPDGTPWTVNFGTPTETVAVDWTAGANHTPIVDIRAVVNTYKALGIKFGAMMMSQTTFDYMILSTTLLAAAPAFFINVPGGQERFDSTGFFTVGLVNTYLQAVGLPTIIIEDTIINTEDLDGTKTSVQPFADLKVVFLPSFDLGKMYWTYTNEMMLPVSGREYANFDNALVKRWYVGVNEYTESELPAFPVFSNVNQTPIMEVDTTP